MLNTEPREDIRRIHQHVEVMRQRNVSRDQDSELVRIVRRGKLHEYFPGYFADDMPQMTIANAIDNAARDTAELIAPLPSLACAAGNMSSAKDVARAALKNKVASYYWEKSQLAVQNINFADAATAYAFGVYLIEPDFQHKCPRIRWENSFGTYYYKDRFRRLVWYAKYTQVDMLTIVGRYPDAAPFIKYKNGREQANHELVTVVTYKDRERDVVYLPDYGHLVLAEWQHNLGVTMAAIAERPDQEDTPSGQYDQAVFPMIAKHVITMAQMSAAKQAVEAPIAIPDDVQDLPSGPNAVIRTQNGIQGVGRVRLDIPDDVFAVAEQLDRAVKEGSRYPEARSGGISGSIVTGKGVEALAGTLNTQVRTMQTVVGRALEEATELCFRLDVALWPTEQKQITGVLTGKPFEVKYIPARDIGDSYSCKVTYGFASGQTPAQAIVALLQLRGDKLISRDTFRRQLPFDLDPDEEQRAVDLEDASAAALQGMLGLSQALGPITMQGQDPMKILQAQATFMKLRKRGKSVEDALIEAFTPPEPDPNALPPEGAPGVPGQPADPAMGPQGPGGPEMPPGVRDNGLMEGVPYGQAGSAPGGMPAIQSLLSRLRGQGSPVMEASVSRKRAIGA